MQAEFNTGTILKVYAHIAEVKEGLRALVERQDELEKRVFELERRLSPITPEQVRRATTPLREVKEV